MKRSYKFGLQLPLQPNNGICEFALSQAVEKKTTGDCSNYKKFTYYFLSMITHIIYKAHGRKVGIYEAMVAKYCYEFLNSSLDDNDFELVQITNTIKWDMRNINNLNADQVKFVKKCVIAPLSVRQKYIQVLFHGLCFLNLSGIIKYYTNQSKLIKNNKATRLHSMIVHLSIASEGAPLLDAIYNSLLKKSLMTADIMQGLSEYLYFVYIMHRVLDDMSKLKLKQSVSIGYSFSMISNYFFLEGSAISNLNILNDKTVKQVGSIFGLLKQSEAKTINDTDNHNVYSRMIKEATSLWESGSSKDHTQMRRDLMKKYAVDDLDEKYLNKILSGIAGKYGKRRGSRQRQNDSW